MGQAFVTLYKQEPAVNLKYIGPTLTEYVAMMGAGPGLLIAVG